MIELIRKWRQKWLPSTARAANYKVAPAWTAMEEAVRGGNLKAVFDQLPAWSELPEADIANLTEVLGRVGVSAQELARIEIFFEYHVRKIDIAFARAQIYMDQHGFDQDMHVVSLMCFYQNNQFEDALTYLDRVDEAEVSTMKRGDYWAVRAAILGSNNQLQRAQAAMDQALEFDPDNGAIASTALGFYIEMGAQEKVDKLRSKVTDGYSYALSLLALGECEQGFRHAEARYDCSEAHRFINLGLKPYPRWQGESIAGLRLLVSAEQGLGDTVQMARYFPSLLSLGAREIIFESQPEALPLMQYNFPEISMVERKWGTKPPQDFDIWTSAMSLPYLLQAWGGNIPGKSGYLGAPSENVDYWKSRVAKLVSRKRPKIGLAWSGQAAHRADRRRSIPFLQIMQKVSNIPAYFFALQTQIAQVLPANVTNVSEEMLTLADTAALIEQMDLVITVDTSVVHVAGALGKETWLLLPKRYEWRWGMEGEENDWYDAVKVIRQTEHSNWEPVLRDVFEYRLRERFDFQEV